MAPAGARTCTCRITLRPARGRTSTLVHAAGRPFDAQPARVSTRSRDDQVCSPRRKVWTARPRSLRPRNRLLADTLARSAGLTIQVSFGSMTATLAGAPSISGPPWPHWSRPAMAPVSSSAPQQPSPTTLGRGARVRSTQLPSLFESGHTRRSIDERPFLAILRVRRGRCVASIEPS